MSFAILQVVLPLVAAPICMIFNARGAAWLIASLTTLASFAMAVFLLNEVAQGGVLVYSIGNWDAPVGIEFRIDTLSAFVLVLISAIGAITTLFARRSVAKEIVADRAPAFYCLHLLNFGGLSGMAATGDLFNLFVFLEISSLSTYALIALGTDRRALSAAFQYLVIGTVGATFYVIGVGLLYSMTGSLNLADLVPRVAELSDSLTIRTAFAFMLVGLGIKLGMMPLHFWLPNAYTFAPSIISVFLAATATKVAIYVLLRIIFVLFGSDLFVASHIDWVVLVAAVFAMFAGSAAAALQTNVKRLLAMSSLAQVGYILLGISLASIDGVRAAILHLFNHGLMKGALFFAIAAVIYRINSAKLEDMQGLARNMPLTFLAIALGGFSLIGLPLTVGFISKWYLVLAAIEGGGWILAALILASSLLAVIYVWRIVEMGYMRPRPPGAIVVEEAPWTFLLPIWILVGANLYFGVNAELTAGIASRAATMLIEVAP